MKRHATGLQLSQMDAEVFCLSIFLIGRLKSAHESVLAEVQLETRTTGSSCATHEWMSTTQAASFQNDNKTKSTSKLSFLFSKNSAGLSSNISTLLEQLAAEITENSSLDFTAFMLLHSGLSLLDMEVGQKDDVWILALSKIIIFLNNNNKYNNNICVCLSFRNLQSPRRLAPVLRNATLD